MPVSGSEPDLSWLADAPVFIDGQQIGAFYDAVVGPGSGRPVSAFSGSDRAAGKIRREQRERGVVCVVSLAEVRRRCGNAQDRR
jgi:hypothetical protein